MTKQEFSELAEKETIILDGATGSNLMKLGLPKGVCTELWILDHPETILQLQKEYVNAGSRIIYAPTFAANRMNLKYYDAADRIQEINRSLVELSKEAAGDRAYVAGDVTTTGKALDSSDEVTYESVLEMYKEQITYLVEAGVDLLVAETMISMEETMAILDAASCVSELPVMCTLTIEADGSIFFGGNLIEAAMALEEMGAAAVGLNCSVGPDQLESIVSCVKQAVSIPVIVKPNAGMPVITETGEAVYSMGPKDFAMHMKKLVDAGAGIVGGCCGTDPEFISEMKKCLSH